jgi:hypothetical protein
LQADERYPALARHLHVLQDVCDTAHLRAELLGGVNLIDKAGNPLGSGQPDNRLLLIKVQLPYGIEVVERCRQVKRRRDRRCALDFWRRQEFIDTLEILVKRADIPELQDAAVDINAPATAGIRLLSLNGCDGSDSRRSIK